MPKSQAMEDFLTERAVWLGSLWLTRREDVQVSTSASHDLLVTLLQEGRPSRRRFEVVLKAEVLAESDVSSQTGPTLSLSLTEEEFANYQEAPTPVLLFFFKMRNDDESFFRWLVEPVVNENLPYPAQLIAHRSGVLHKLSDEQIDNIIEAVHRWYDTRVAASSRNMSAAA